MELGTYQARVKRNNLAALALALALDENIKRTLALKRALALKCIINALEVQARTTLAEYYNNFASVRRNQEFFRTLIITIKIKCNSSFCNYHDNLSRLF